MTFFAIVTDVIDEFRGDILKFCGDSLIISWSISSGDICTSPNQLEQERFAAILLATNCALSLMTNKLKVPVFSTDDEFLVDNADLKLHCGVGAGMIRGFCVVYISNHDYL